VKPATSLRFVLTLRLHWNVHWAEVEDLTSQPNTL